MHRFKAKSAAICFVTGISLIMTVCQSAHAGDGWPLRNGDFSRPEFIRQMIRPDWRHHFWPGTKVFREDRDPREPVLEDPWRPGVLNLQATNADRPAAVFQAVWLLPGEYTFRLQVYEEGTSLLMKAGSSKTKYERTYFPGAGAGWADVAVNFSVEKAGDVEMYVGTEAAGNAKVRDARIDVHKVKSAPVPLEDGRVLGAIVLAEKPTEAEQYAAWELQKFIFKMTGKAPGLTGRDATAEGVRIYLGSAVDDKARARLDGLNEDGYVVELRGDALFLAGTNDRGTLYAAYDFLKQQGCGWYWPGPSGEIVPERSALEMPSQLRVESPDWVIRGMDKKRPDWNASSWMRINLDDYIDWLVRNRQNALLASQSLTIDFGKWRGGSWGLRTNHTVANFWWKDGKPIKPEWAPLVNGKRKPKHISGRRNMPCTSNQDLRDHTVEVILKFFKQRPEINVFGVNVDDGQMNWCECEHCRAQDPDEGKGAWKTDKWGTVPFPMTDRWMNYISEVAERVGKVYPDKFIETYAYADVRPAPQRTRVPANVMIRFSLYPGESPYGISMRNQAYETNTQLKRTLDDWRKAGAQDMAVYDYDNHTYPDIVYTYFYRMADSMRVLHDDFGFRNYMAEQHILITAASHMAQNLRARVLWDADTDYRQVIREVCDALYGPAADTMYDYYCHMDQVVLDYWKKNLGAVKVSGRSVRGLQEYTFADMEAGKALLDKAWKEIGDDATLRDRVARVRFGHAMAILAMSMTAVQVEEVAPGTRKMTREVDLAAKAAWQEAKDLRAEYNIIGSKRLNHLIGGSFYLPPRIKEELFTFPVTWQFKKDPDNKGLKEKWYQQVPDKSWVPIETNQFWTHQPQGKGYYGAAWYSVEFTLPDKVKASLQKSDDAKASITAAGATASLHFGAVDGLVDIFMDGKKIGEQKKAPGLMWKRPFAIRLYKESFADQEKHRLTLRVEKHNFAAGIWKPVKIAIIAE